MLLGAIAANLALLGYFKYTNFMIDNVNLIAGASLPHWHIILPVGISFYTFIQIGFLVEVYNRQVKEVRLDHYLLFGTFFPCVTAGPIILQREMLPQLAGPPAALLDGARIATALTVFGIGLCKKLLLADAVAPFADAVFDGAADGAAVGAAHAWIGALAYTLQLYFDFSGYSDMALGVAFLFGLRLPLNFNSPLKACSIIDFWRRWHITMTRFFTNYLHAPIALPLMRRALARRYGRGTRFLVATALPIVADLRARRPVARRRLDLRRVRPDPRAGTRGQPRLARGPPARAAAVRRLAPDHGGRDRRAGVLPRRRPRRPRLRCSARCSAWRRRRPLADPGFAPGTALAWIALLGDDRARLPEQPGADGAALVQLRSASRRARPRGAG